MSASTLQLIGDKVSCVRGARLVLNDLSFTCHAEAPLIVRGPNGAGKSTLLRAVAGLVTVSSGAIRLSGGDVGGDRPLDAEHIHYVGHGDGVKSVLTVRENVSFWSSFLGSRDPKAVDQAIEAFALESVSDLPAQYLSAGQRRRLALARLVAAKRTVWLLDEPTASLDTASAALLEQQMDAHCRSGGLLMLATHDALTVAGAHVLDLSPVQGNA